MRSRRLHFLRRPRTDVRFTGPPDSRSQSTSSRRHLDEPVRPGVDYRDARVTYRLVNRLTAGSARREDGRGDRPGNEGAAPRAEPERHGRERGHRFGGA
ncbi:hypothetical protein GCM10018793_45650 [Streptomyces sulfonofaciens]|uniref:Uncharacterized protein n=1 Tax=Streptomyces sulfonofaciens TaxID=68272 RepID=A0A919L4A6_9ACTN|nr:hypothetical protein [Streptomyces sulfonofaciens]GHH83473.1 hypothetical protein GCM10018793_45650 [Streptomyces sulfonofaciens]